MLAPEYGSKFLLVMLNTDEPNRIAREFAAIPIKTGATSALSPFSHAAFAPYQSLTQLIGDDQSPECFSAIATQLGICHARHDKPLIFSAEPKIASASDYEQTIAQTGVVPTRENNLHDFLNALVWLRFPLLKSAINLRHCQQLAASASEHQQRGILRDRLTLLDESGVLVATPNQGLLNLLQNRQWLELFWDNRAEAIQNMRFLVVGHGLLEKCLKPFPGMTGKCLFIDSEETSPEKLDAIAAEILQGAQVLKLPPLPIQGVPGWSENHARETYLDTQVFRPIRTLQSAS